MPSILYSKTCLKPPLTKKTKTFFKTDYRLTQVKSTAEHSAILSTFIKLPIAIKTFVLSFFKWPLKTSFTVQGNRKIESRFFSWLIGY